MQTGLVIPFSMERSNKLDIAAAYYRLFSAWFRLNLTEPQIAVIAYLAVNNGIASGGTKQKFLQTYPKTTSAALDMLISRLKKRKLLISTTGTRKPAQLHPKLMVNFNTEYKMEFTCVLKEAQML